MRDGSEVLGCMIFLLQWICLMRYSVNIHFYMSSLIGFTYGCIGGPDDLHSNHMELVALRFRVR
jgi:hypothetical protein